MLKLGKFNRLVVEKTTEFGFYLSDGTDRRNMVLLPNKYVPENLDVDDEIDVFLYLDSEDRIVATTQTPLAQLGGPCPGSGSRNRPGSGPSSTGGWTRTSLSPSANSRCG